MAPRLLGRAGLDRWCSDCRLLDRAQERARARRSLSYRGSLRIQRRMELARRRGDPPRMRPRVDRHLGARPALSIRLRLVRRIRRRRNHPPAADESIPPERHCRGIRRRMTPFIILLLVAVVIIIAGSSWRRKIAERENAVRTNVDQTLQLDGAPEVERPTDRSEGPGDLEPPPVD